MGKFRISVFLIIIPLLIVSCSREDDINPPISNIPYLELREISDTEITALDEVLVITLFYQDGDGDIGFESADSSVLFVLDSRLSEAQGYHIQPLAPVDTAITIQGILEFELDNIPILEPGASSETVTFELWIRDRNNNLSNTVLTEPVELVE